jgi:hypothetical protein
MRMKRDARNPNTCRIAGVRSTEQSAAYTVCVYKIGNPKAQTESSHAERA